MSQISTIPASASLVHLASLATQVAIHQRACMDAMAVVGEKTMTPLFDKLKTKTAEGLRAARDLLQCSGTIAECQLHDRQIAGYFVRKDDNPTVTAGLQKLAQFSSYLEGAEKGVELLSAVSALMQARDFAGALKVLDGENDFVERMDVCVKACMFLNLGDVRQWNNDKELKIAEQSVQDLHHKLLAAALATGQMAAPSATLHIAEAG